MDAAVQACREAVNTVRGDDPNRAMCLSNLGIVLRLRSAVTGHAADLDAAIRASQEAVEAARPDDPSLAGGLSNLGNALWLRFEMAGDAADLDRAIQAGRSAVTAARPGQADRPGYMSNLARALLARFDIAGTQADLDEAIGAWQAIVESAPPGHPALAMFLNSLGEARQARFERKGTRQDLDEHASRRIRILGATPHPTGEWTAQQARNLIMDLGEQAHQVKFMIRDRGSNFTAAFDAVLADAGIRTVLCSVRTPRMNAIAERWIGGCRRELLDRTLIWNQDHLRRNLRQYESHHNRHRPHRSLNAAAPLKPLTRTGRS